MTGLEVFPGDVRQFFLELQPFFVTRKVLTRASAQAMYEDWERWKNVGYTVTDTATLEHSIVYEDFRMIKLDSDQVEEVKYFNKWTNEFQIMLNGVLMLPVGFPLSAHLGVCEYPFSKGDDEPISANFFWSKFRVIINLKMNHIIMYFVPDSH